MKTFKNGWQEEEYYIKHYGFSKYNVRDVIEIQQHMLEDFDKFGHSKIFGCKHKVMNKSDE